jgi:hypothetical protein
MSLPAFSAEASLYKTRGCYRLASGGLLLNGVVPQGCGFLDWLECAVIIQGGAAEACIPRCFDACKEGQTACAACVYQCLPAPVSNCKDCLVGLILDLIGSGDSGSGSGGPVPCCPTKTPYCCGTCQPLPGGRGYHCDGTCAKSREFCQ